MEVLQEEHVLGCVDVRQAMSFRCRDQTLFFVIFGFLLLFLIFVLFLIFFCHLAFQPEILEFRPSSTCPGKKANIFFSWRPLGRCKSGLWLEAAHLSTNLQVGFARKTANRSIGSLPSQCGGWEILSGNSHREAFCIVTCNTHLSWRRGQFCNVNGSKLFTLSSMHGAQHGRTPKNAYLYKLLGSPLQIWSFLCPRHAVSYCISAAGWKTLAKGNLL